jgi:radical SAM protein (TIGR01212 family)
VTLASPAPAAGHEPPFRAFGERWYRYARYLKERLGGPARRVSIDAGFTCPNVDGTVARGGCVYCDNKSFTPARRLAERDIGAQIATQVAKLDRRYGEENGYLAYFQAATNTYGELDELRALYDEAVSQPRIRGLIVSTRPDCVPDPVLDLLETYARRRNADGSPFYVSVEYGLQTVHQRTLEWMNRGHDAASYFDAVKRTRERAPSLDVVAHVILGLPGESKADMMATIDGVAESGVDGVKIHSLHVVKNSLMYHQWRRGQVQVIERDAYIDVLIDALERLPASMVIHRLMGDAPPSDLVAPEWAREKPRFLQALAREMDRRSSWQGKAYPMVHTKAQAQVQVQVRAQAPRPSARADVPGLGETTKKSGEL